MRLQALATSNVFQAVVMLFFCFLYIVQHIIKLIKGAFTVICKGNVMDHMLKTRDSIFPPKQNFFQVFKSLIVLKCCARFCSSDQSILDDAPYVNLC